MSSFQISLLSGLTGFILVSLTVLGGLKVIKMKFKLHRGLGIACLAWALLHGLGAFLVYLGLF
jgi:DMSO/TMAO reductase YedYZ heme-binding membrane subunit